MRRGRVIKAGVSDVLKRIEKRIWNSELARKMSEKVKKFFQTKNPQDDISPHEAVQIYPGDEFGEQVPLSKKRDLDIDWTSHAEYRSELRDVNPDRVNEAIRERLREKLPNPEKKVVRFKEPGVGTFVLDYDMRQNPVQADVVTVWARLRSRRARRK